MKSSLLVQLMVAAAAVTAAAPAFADQNSKLVLEDALQRTRSDSQLKVSYSKFVEDLVAGEAPAFDVALATFTRLAAQLIGTLD